MCAMAKHGYRKCSDPYAEKVGVDNGDWRDVVNGVSPINLQIGRPNATRSVHSLKCFAAFNENIQELPLKRCKNMQTTAASGDPTGSPCLAEDIYPTVDGDRYPINRVAAGLMSALVTPEDPGALLIGSPILVFAGQL